jgi:hypothetical protein
MGSSYNWTLMTFIFSLGCLVEVYRGEWVTHQEGMIIRSTIISRNTFGLVLREERPYPHLRYCGSSTEYHYFLYYPGFGFHNPLFGFQGQHTSFSNVPRAYNIQMVRGSIMAPLS